MWLAFAGHLWVACTGQEKMHKSNRAQFHCHRRSHQLQSQSSKHLSYETLLSYQCSGIGGNCCNSMWFTFTFQRCTGPLPHGLVLNKHQTKAEKVKFYAHILPWGAQDFVLALCWAILLTERRLRRENNLPCGRGCLQHRFTGIFHLLFLMQHFCFFLYLSQVQDPNSIFANTTVVCVGCQIQRNKTADFGRLHWN